MGWMIWDWIHGRGKRFFSSPKCPDWLWGPPSDLLGAGVLSLGIKQREFVHSQPYSCIPIMLLWHGQWHLSLFISLKLFWDSLVSPLVFPSRIPIKLVIWKKSLLQNTFSLLLLFGVLFLHNACYNKGTAQFWLYQWTPPPLALCWCLLAHSWNVMSFGLVLLSMHCLLQTGVQEGI